MKIYKLSQNKDAERAYYVAEGRAFLASLKEQIPKTVGGTLTVLMEREALYLPSDAKWHQEEYKKTNFFTEMGRLRGQLSAVKNPIDLYEFMVFIEVNALGQYQFTGKVYEMQHDPEVHKNIERDRNEKIKKDKDQTANMSHIFEKFSADRKQIGYFNDDQPKHKYFDTDGLKLPLAHSTQEAADRIKTIIWNNGNNGDNEFDILDTPTPADMEPAPNTLSYASSKGAMNIYRIAQSDFQGRIRMLVPQICQAAQKAYDVWEQDEEGIDLMLGSGGICQDIAEEISSVLSTNGINCGEVDNNGMGEQHVWVVAWENDEKPYNAYAIDIHPYLYESGGGYNWKKTPGVVFSPKDIMIYKTEESIVEYIQGET